MMRILIAVALVIMLIGCGTYVGSEGIKYNSGTMTGFRNPERDKKIAKAFEMLKESKIIDEIPELSDNTIDIVKGKKVVKAFSGWATQLVGAQGIIGYALVIIMGLFRTKEEE